MANTSYYEWVYEVTKQIPKGRVSTYGYIADYLALGSARMVGWALAQLASGQGIPAHRVVNHKGELSGRHHFRPPEKMQQLLELEGLIIIDSKVADFKSFVWVPANELDQVDADL